jgi:tetratricopeptide (TPR) repeat protein
MGRRYRAAAWCVAVLLVSWPLGGCGDSQGRWSRYQVEKLFFSAHQAAERATLHAESGQATDRQALTRQFESALEEFAGLRPQLTVEDSAILRAGAQARLRLARLRQDDFEWELAAEQYRAVVSDALYPTHYRYVAHMELGRSLERLDQFPEAVAQYRQLLHSFYPPQSEGGVNREVLGLPLRLVVLAENRFPDSLDAYQAYAEAYYDTLATAYPHTALGVSALGELAKLYAYLGLWPRVVATLERATDSTGTILPAYWVDIGEIAAQEMADTARAIAIFQDVAQRFPETPYRVDADMKRATILMQRGEFEAARKDVARLKEEFEDRLAVVVPAQLLYARLYQAEGSWERARAEFTYLVTNFPQTTHAVEAAHTIARHYRNTDETTRSEEWYNRADDLAAAIARAGEMPPALVATAINMRVAMAVERDDWDAAATHLSEMAERFGPASTPGSAALERLGWLHLDERADTSAAGAAWQTLLDAYPEHPQAEVIKAEMNKWPTTRNTDFPS